MDDENQHLDIENQDLYVESHDLDKSNKYYMQLHYKNCMQVQIHIVCCFVEIFGVFWVCKSASATVTSPCLQECSLGEKTACRGSQVILKKTWRVFFINQFSVIHNSTICLPNNLCEHRICEMQEHKQSVLTFMCFSVSYTHLTLPTMRTV